MQLFVLLILGLTSNSCFIDCMKRNFSEVFAPEYIASDDDTSVSKKIVRTNSSSDVYDAARTNPTTPSVTPPTRISSFESLSEQLAPTTSIATTIKKFARQKTGGSNGVQSLVKASKTMRATIPKAPERAIKIKLPMSGDVATLNDYTAALTSVIKQSDKINELIIANDCTDERVLETFEKVLFDTNVFSQLRVLSIEKLKDTEWIVRFIAHCPKLDRVVCHASIVEPAEIYRQLVLQHHDTDLPHLESIATSQLLASASGLKTLLHDEFRLVKDNAHIVPYLDRYKKIVLCGTNVIDDSAIKFFGCEELFLDASSYTRCTLSASLFNKFPRLKKWRCIVNGTYRSSFQFDSSGEPDNGMLPLLESIDVQDMHGDDDCSESRGLITWLCRNAGALESLTIACNSENRDDKKTYALLFDVLLRKQLLQSVKKLEIKTQCGLGALDCANIFNTLPHLESFLCYAQTETTHAWWKDAASIHKFFGALRSACYKNITTMRLSYYKDEFISAVGDDSMVKFKERFPNMHLQGESLFPWE